MGRLPAPSVTLPALLRQRLGLSREELGLLLGVSGAQVGHVETGRRGLSAQAQARLHRLVGLLPAVTLEAAPELGPPGRPSPGPTPAETAALRKRLRNCRRTLHELRYRQAGPAARAELLERRRHTLTRLAEALADPTHAPDPQDRPGREQEWLELLELGTRRLHQQQPTPTALAWQALRIRLLETEIQGLQELLGEDEVIK